MRHHTLAELEDFIRMTLTACDMSDSQVTGIDEADELGALVIEQRIASHGVCGAWPKIFVSRLNVRSLFIAIVSISTVAVGAAKHYRVGRMHRADIAMALNAGGTLGVGQILRLPIQINVS